MIVYMDIEATEAGEILQIGCVTQHNQRFGICTRPEFTPVTPRITALTGITQEDADESMSLNKALFILIDWLNQQSEDIQIYAFGKNDIGFIQKTYDFYFLNGKSPDDPLMQRLKYLKLKTANCQSYIYNAFRYKGLSLRSYYLTMNNQPLPHDHNAMTDAVYLYQIMSAIDSGWTLPDGAEIVKFHKPTLPPKVDPCEANGTMTADLNRKVVAYYVNNKGKDCAQVFPNCVAAARALCQQAINSGSDQIEAGRRVLDAALAGTYYCNRKFFLVD